VLSERLHEQSSSNPAVDPYAPATRRARTGCGCTSPTAGRRTRTSWSARMASTRRSAARVSHDNTARTAIEALITVTVQPAGRGQARIARLPTVAADIGVHSGLVVVEGAGQRCHEAKDE
jgi:hypothetical protein